MNEHVVHPSVAQRIIIKFLTDEKPKLTEILLRLNRGLVTCSFEKFKRLNDAEYSNEVVLQQKISST